MSANRFLSLGTQPGALFVCLLQGGGGGITAQIAVKMSVDAMVDQALSAVESPQASEHPFASEIVRRSFKEANTQVYQYGHRIGAGGRISATGMLLAVADGRCTVGRVGDYQGFLLRGNKLSPLFEDLHATTSGPGALSRYIGANAQILVDLASVVVALGDRIVFCNFPVSESQHGELQDELTQNSELALLAQNACARLRAGMNSFPAHPMLLGLLEVEQPTILLQEVVE